MRRIYFGIIFLTALFRVQAQEDDRSPTGAYANFRDLDAEDGIEVINPAAAAGRTDDNGVINPGGWALDINKENSQPQTAVEPNQFVIATPEGPGIHAGFQAIGSNYATSVSGGLKSSDGATLETGLNLAGRFGDSGQPRVAQQQLLPQQQQQQQSQQSQQSQSRRNQIQRSTNAQQSPQVPSTTSQNIQGTSAPLQDEGATFAVSYKPGLLNAIGNMLNPFRLFQQFGDAVAGFGQAIPNFGQGIASLGQSMPGLGQVFPNFGQGNAMMQAQSQYTPPQAQRTNNNDGVGVTWKPLYRAFV